MSKCTDPSTTPCTTCLSCIPPTPASAACFAHAITVYCNSSRMKHTTLYNISQPRTAKRCSEMAFLIDERVSCAVMRKTLSSTRKAISLHLLVVRGCEIVCFILLELLWLEQSKLQRSRTLKGSFQKEYGGSPANGEQQLRECGTYHKPYQWGQMESPPTKVM